MSRNGRRVAQMRSGSPPRPLRNPPRNALRNPPRNPPPTPLPPPSATTSSVILSPQHPLSSGLTSDSRLVRAYRGERSDTTPVWFMRQAGRSLPEYRELRVGTHMLDACLDPAMAS